MVVGSRRYWLVLAVCFYGYCHFWMTVELVELINLCSLASLVDVGN